MSGIVSADLVRKLLTLDTNSGKMTWNHRSEGMFPTYKAFRVWNGKNAGKPAFTSVTVSGYHQGRIFARNYTAHRVIWAHHYGEWPSGHVDHINGVRTDNRICNLRIATNQKNQMNRTSLSGSSSQYLGVSFYKSRGKWEANIQMGDYKKRIGYFNSEMDAALAYDVMARKLFGEFANPNFNIDGTRRNRATA